MPSPVPLLFQDERLLVVDKPAGLLTVGEGGRGPGGLAEALAAQGVVARAVHRLDRDVSGVVVMSCDEEAHGALEAMFRERAVSKTYWALAQGRYQEQSGIYRWPIDERGPEARVDPAGKPAETRWRVIVGHAVATEMEIDLVTGRRNQIRVHFAHGGHPLVGERRYARGRDQKIHFKSRRIALHAWRVAFDHPFGGARIAVEAPLPDDLIELRSQAASTR